jgi:hypothetical protein
LVDRELQGVWQLTTIFVNQAQPVFMKPIAGDKSPFWPASQFVATFAVSFVKALAVGVAGVITVRLAEISESFVNVQERGPAVTP